MRQQSERVYMRVSTEFLQRITRLAKQKQVTVSAFIREAALEKAEALESKKKQTNVAA